MALNFDERGFLPEGAHPCDEDQFCELLVDPFSSGSTRPTIRDGFFELRRRASGHGLSGRQWVGGSFVTKKESPGDVDVVTFARVEHLNSLPDDAKLFVRETLARHGGAKAFMTDSFVVGVCDPGDPHYVAYDRWRQYWRDLFGHTRPLPTPSGGTMPGLAKGILNMGLGNPTDQPNVSEGVQDSAA